MASIIIASGPLIVENGKVLLNRHGDDNFWKFCGGKVEDYDTSLIENAKREVKEEMGIEIKILDENPFIIHTAQEKQGKMTDIILVHYLSERVGEIKPGEDIREWDWFDIKNLPEGLAPNIEPVLKHFGFM